MRKNLVIGCALLAAALLFTGSRFFGNAKTPAEKLRIATGGESGVYYAYGNALAEALEKRMNIPVTAIRSGGSIGNLRLLRNGRAELAFVQNDIMTYAYNGTHLFSTEGEFKEFSALAALYPETCQIVARREINGILELKGRRVSVGDEGSGTELNAMQILEAYGMTYADIDADHLSFAASAAAFKEGRIDAFFCTAGVPTPAVAELAAGGEIRLLNVGDAHARFLISRYPFYTRQIIPKGTYPGIDEDSAAVAVKAVLVTSGKLGGQAVSEVVGTLRTLPGRGGLSREAALEGITIPMHPEAEKHFF